MRTKSRAKAIRLNNTEKQVHPSRQNLQSTIKTSLTKVLLKYNYRHNLLSPYLEVPIQSISKFLLITLRECILLVQGIRLFIVYRGCKDVGSCAGCSRIYCRSDMCRYLGQQLTSYWYKQLFRFRNLSLGNIYFQSRVKVAGKRIKLLIKCSIAKYLHTKPGWTRFLVYFFYVWKPLGIHPTGVCGGAVCRKRAD